MLSKFGVGEPIAKSNDAILIKTLDNKSVWVQYMKKANNKEEIRTAIKLPAVRVYEYSN